MAEEFDFATIPQFQKVRQPNTNRFSTVYHIDASFALNSDGVKLDSGIKTDADFERTQSRFREHGVILVHDDFAQSWSGVQPLRESRAQARRKGRYMAPSTPVNALLGPPCYEPSQLNVRRKKGKEGEIQSVK